MEWNTKWGWENHEIFSSKVIISPKKLQSTQWEEDIDGSFNLSASDVGNNSSAKSSISASTESSLKEGINVSSFSFGEFRGLPKHCSMKNEFVGCDQVDGNSSLLEASVSSVEPFIGLKLGKRTYFENNFGSENSKTSTSSDIPISSGKKAKPTCQSMPVIRCQVEGCNLDLSSAKEYHRKHRVCESHSKCPKVVVAGLERRFCQQCSRFHGLGEFDEKKRSCRRRLSDHNARRRKPQQDTIHFNSTSLSSSYYGGKQHLSFVLNNAPVVQTRPVVSSTWENSSNSMPTIAFNRPLPSKGTRVEILDQDFKDSLPPNVDALDIRRALSLLSNNSWGLDEPDLIGFDHPQPLQSDNPTITQRGMQTFPQGLPFSLPDYWQTEQQPIDPHSHALTTTKTNNPATTQFQEFQLFNRLYSNPMDDILKPL